MKNNICTRLTSAGFFLLLAIPFCTGAQDSTKHELVLTISYFTNDNKIDYLLVNSKTKIAGKFQPVSGININLFLDKQDSLNLIAKIMTDDAGLGKAILPPALKAIWESSAKHIFSAKSDANKDFDSNTSEIEITKAKISIDTSSDADTKKITVAVKYFDGKEWLPAPGVEVKVGITRDAGSILPAADEATYTTDSSGSATGEFKRLKLPGDENGNINLAAKVEDNDQYGNLYVQKLVPWGIAVKTNDNFFLQRTLWTTRFRTPIWLLFVAYSIVIGVWGTIIYLVFQIIKIKKLGSPGN